MIFEAAPLHVIPELPLKSEHYNNALPLWRFYCKCSWLTQPEACAINWWVWLDAASALSFFPGSALSDTGIRPAETPAQHLLIGQMWAADLLRFMNCESSGRITLAHCLSCWAQWEFCREFGQRAEAWSICARPDHACSQVHWCMYMYTCVYVYTYVCVCTWIHVQVCMRMHVLMYQYVYIYMYIYICICY